MPKKKTTETQATSPDTPAIEGRTLQPSSPLRLPLQAKAAPLGFQTMGLTAASRGPELTSATSATIATTASVISKPAQSLIASKTGLQRSAGQRVFGPGQRAGIRVVRI
jgi:hypothetical protein